MIPKYNVHGYVVAVLLAGFLLVPHVCAGEDAPAVWTLSSWERVLRSEDSHALKPVALSVACNEWESFQIAIRSERPTEVFAIEVKPPVSESGKSIPASGIRRYRAHQLHVTTPTHRNESFKAGWYPDALIPFRIPREADKLPPVRFRAVPFTVPARETHTFWIDIHVPEGTEPGDYSSEAIVQIKGGSGSRCRSRCTYGPSLCRGAPPCKPSSDLPQLGSSVGIMLALPQVSCR